MADTHSVMPKKLAMALIESGISLFDGGGIFGGLGNILGTNSTFKAEGPRAQNQNFLPQIATEQQRQGDVYGQQQNLANTLLQQSQGAGPNPAQAQLAQQTGNNIAQQAALMAGQRGASANPGLIARQAAMQGGALQQQSVGQGASLQAQQQLAAQQALQQQQAQMQSAALQGEGIQQGGLASQNNAALGVQQINANTAGQNAAGNRGLVGGLIGGAAGALTSALGFAEGGEIPDVPFSNALLNGGKVPGKADVKGDSKENDTEPTMLSPGEAVIPRSIMNSPDMERKALEFLKHLKKKKGGYSDVADAKVKRKACGGRV